MWAQPPLHLISAAQTIQHFSNLDSRSYGGTFIFDSITCCRGQLRHQIQKRLQSRMCSRLFQQTSMSDKQNQVALQNYNGRREDRQSNQQACLSPVESTLHCNPECGPWHLHYLHTWAERNKWTKDSAACNPVKGLKVQAHSRAHKRHPCFVWELPSDLHLFINPYRINTITRTALNPRNLKIDLNSQPEHEAADFKVLTKKTLFWTAFLILDMPCL